MSNNTNVEELITAHLNKIRNLRSTRENHVKLLEEKQLYENYGSIIKTVKEKRTESAKRVSGM